MRPFALFLMIVSWASAQERPLYTSNVQLVAVDVQVTEKGTGNILEFFGPKDFEIYENGIRRDVSVFDIETIPLDLVFLVYGRDGWGSEIDVTEFCAGLSAAVSALRPGDRAAVLRTDTATKLTVPLSSDREKVRRGLLYEDPKNPTGHDHLYDAVSAATAIFPKPINHARRRTIIAITDDIERDSKIPINRLIEDLLESDVTLNAVVVVLGKREREIGIGGIPRISRSTGGSPSGSSIRPAVDATGGELVPGDMFQERFPMLVQRIRMRYLLGFYAAEATRKEYRTIEVRLTPDASKRYPNASIKARNGYYAQPIK